jgi:hypothetical protein
MDITRFTTRNDNSVPFDSNEFDAGYLVLSTEELTLGEVAPDVWTLQTPRSRP